MNIIKELKQKQQNKKKGGFIPLPFLLFYLLIAYYIVFFIF
jgi:hypothetical protein